MNKVWTVWIAEDYIAPRLVGVATTVEIACEMREKVAEVFKDSFTYKCKICCMDVDKLNIDNIIIF